MAYKNDLVNQRFGRLLVLKGTGKRKGHSLGWICVCDCGITTEVRGDYLKMGHTKSCGCLCGENAFKHGHKTPGKHSPTYTSWMGAKRRCTNPTEKNWPNYGGRGIRMCARWLNSFPNFLSDMGLRPVNTTIDRINNDGDYEPGNCRWASPVQQSNNRRPMKPWRKTCGPLLRDNHFRSEYARAHDWPKFN
jgi:hypothetical protein